MLNVPRRFAARAPIDAAIIDQGEPIGESASPVGNAGTRDPSRAAIVDADDRKIEPAEVVFVDVGGFLH